MHVNSSGIGNTTTPHVLRSVLLVETWHALNLANDLANAGLTVYILGNGGYKARWMPSGVILLPPACTSPEHVVGSIEAAVKAVSPDIILPVSEETLVRIWDEAPDWLPLVQPAVEPDKRALYSNKHLLGAFVQGHGVLIPRTRLLKKGTPEEISPIIDDLGLPVVVKGARGFAGNQVRIVESHAAAFQAATELRRRTGEIPALQELLTGATYLVSGVFDRGRPLHMFCAELVEMLPPRTGPSVLLISHDEPDLMKAASTLFRTLGLSGFACADFVRDRDGHFRFLEVNPRPWGSYSFARALGIDLVGMWCRMLRGEHVPTVVGYPADRSWAKMPEYLFVPPLTRFNMLRRALHPVAFLSWHWHAPRVFLYQARVAYWVFRRLGQKIERSTSKSPHSIVSRSESRLEMQKDR